MRSVHERRGNKLNVRFIHLYMALWKYFSSLLFKTKTKHAQRKSQTMASATATENEAAAASAASATTEQEVAYVGAMPNDENINYRLQAEELNYSIPEYITTFTADHLPLLPGRVVADFEKKRVGRLQKVIVSADGGKTTVTIKVKKKKTQCAGGIRCRVTRQVRLCTGQ